MSQKLYRADKIKAICNIIRPMWGIFTENNDKIFPKKIPESNNEPPHKPSDAYKIK